MTWLIGLALKAGIPARFAKIAVIAALFVGVIALLGVAKCSYDRSVIRAHEAAATAKQAKIERKADANLETQKDKDEAAALERRKEIDNATKGIPDKAPSARQRARACVELRRQARAAGKAEPAC